MRLRLAFTAKYAMQVTWIRILPGRFARNFPDYTLGTRLIFHFTKLGRHSPLSKYRCALRVPSVFATLQTRDEYLFGFKQLHICYRLSGAASKPTPGRQVDFRQVGLQLVLSRGIRELAKYSGRGSDPLAVRVVGQVRSRDIRVAMSDLPVRLYPSVM